MSRKKRGPKKGYKRPKFTEQEVDEFKRKFMEEYRKEGMSSIKASKIAGFPRTRIYKWMQTDPEFAEEYERLTAIKKEKTDKVWKEKHKHDEEYKKKFLEVYADPNESIRSVLKKIDKKLTKNEFDYWIKTDKEFNKKYKELQHETRPRQTDGVEMRSFIKSAKLDRKKEKFINAFIKSRWNITEACKVVDISRQTFKAWCSKDADFNQAIEIAQDQKEDYVESKLFELLEENQPAAVIYATKILLQKTNYGRRHAYIEQPQKIEGHIEHTHRWDQDQMDAAIRGNQLDRTKYNNILGIEESKSAEDIIDVECEEEDD